MTGISGLWYPDGRPGAAEDCARMQAALAVYGPDRSGLWDDGDVALGCRLKRLLPEDRLDRQPATSADGRFVLVADVRLDNRPELAAELGISAGRLAAMADSALLLAAWEAWGEAGINRLYGDFAFAVWDGRTRRLSLVRDFPGMRPLFLHQGRGWIGFASMAKGLHALPDVPVAADLETLCHYLLVMPRAGTNSFFTGIQRVEPGHITVVEADGAVRSTPWWRPPGKLPEPADPRELVETFRATFDRAVADRLRAVGPAASTLSAGLDSSAVTATAAELLAPSGRRLTAYTHVPLPGVPLEQNPARFGDEGPLARLLASRHPNIDHVEVDAADRHIGDDLDRRFYYAESPALNLCNTLWISEITRQAAMRGQTVLLVGTAGNKTISADGLERLNALLYRGRLIAWAREAVALMRAGEIGIKGLGFWSLRPLMTGALEERLSSLFGRRNLSLRDYSPLRPDRLERFLEERPPEARGGNRVVGRNALDRVHQTLLVFPQQEAVTLSRKGMLASHGVDHRDPTADRRLIELSLALPDSLLLRNGQRKWLYHQVFADRVPPEIRLNRRKGLTGADWAERLLRAQASLQGELDRGAACANARDLLDLDVLTTLPASLPDPATARGPVMHTYRLRMLRGLSAAHFLRRVDGGNL